MYQKIKRLGQPRDRTSDRLLEGCGVGTAVVSDVPSPRTYRRRLLKQELEKARAASRQPPIDVEVEHCRMFIAKAEKKVAELFAERHSRVRRTDRSEGPPPAFGGRTSSSYEPPGTLRAVTIEIVPRSLR